MKRLLYGRLLIKLIFILAVFLLPSGMSLMAATSPDAIGIRVMPNPSHFSPLRWYQENVKIKGSPQVLIVDDYEAVRDGRTVYVNAANVPNVLGSDFFTNIYIISYNQQAENQTIDTFDQMLAHWKFNTNISDPIPADAHCSKTVVKNCVYSDECPSGEYCLSLKAKIIRDTRRLANLADIKIALANYQKTHNGNYPSLQAGSYLPGKTISKWPSWQGALGKELSITMSLDPVNKLGTCPAGYNPDTCWNQTTKTFADPSNNGEFNLPENSRAYVYIYNANGSYNLCTLMESGYIQNFAQGACTGSGNPPLSQITINCGELRGRRGEQFNGYVSADYSGRGVLTWQIIPVNLNNITIENTAVANQRRLVGPIVNSAGVYSVTIKVTDNLGSTKSENCSIRID